MGKKDTVTKDYVKNTKVFADLFNFLLYDGRQVINPDRLHELDSTAIALPFGDDGAVLPVQKFRDELKYLSAMEDETAYLVLGVESQSEINYAMPVKNMLYDAPQYSGQVTSAAKSHRETRRAEKIRKIRVCFTGAMGRSVVYSRNAERTGSGNSVFCSELQD